MPHNLRGQISKRTMDNWYLAHVHPIQENSSADEMELMTEDGMLSLAVVLGSSLSLVGLVFAFITYRDSDNYHSRAEGELFFSVFAITRENKPSAYTSGFTWLFLSVVVTTLTIIFHASIRSALGKIIPSVIDLTKTSVKMAFNRLEEIEERIGRVISVAVPRSRLVDRANPLEHYDANEFSLRFHMKKEAAIFIVDLVKNDLCAPIRRGVQIPPLLQVLAVLRFYATNSFQIVIGDLHTFPQPTMSKLVKRVSAAIAKRRHLFVKFPITEDEVTKTRAAFYDIASFPGVTGAIDGTHIRIISPGGDNAELFRNRKGYFSVNVQAVSNASLMFTDLVARWYGSAHDSRIFENSNLYGKLVDREWNGILLGDGGYPCLPFLLTPYDARNMGTGHSKYNKAQIKTRNVVERMFGVWKRRFPCLQFLRLKLSTSLIVIIATAVIHNILRSRGDYYDDDDYDREEVELDVTVPARNNSAQGRAMREAVVARHFT